MYFKARFYDPAVGRFITADPTIPNMFSSQSFNRYMFVSGSPVNFMDDGGYEPETGHAESTTNSVAKGGGYSGGGGSFGGHGVSGSWETNTGGTSASTPSSSSTGGREPAETSNEGSGNNNPGSSNGGRTIQADFSSGGGGGRNSGGNKNTTATSANETNSGTTDVRNESVNNSNNSIDTVVKGNISVDIGVKGWVHIDFTNSIYGNNNLDYAIFNSVEYASFAKEMYLKKYREPLNIGIVSLSVEIQVHAILYKAHINRNTEHNNTSVADCGLAHNLWGNNDDANRWLWDAIETGIMNRNNIYPNTRY